MSSSMPSPEFFAADPDVEEHFHACFSDLLVSPRAETPTSPAALTIALLDVDPPPLSNSSQWSLVSPSSDHGDEFDDGAMCADTTVVEAPADADDEEDALEEEEEEEQEEEEQERECPDSSSEDEEIDVLVVSEFLRRKSLSRSADVEYGNSVTEAEDLDDDLEDVDVSLPVSRHTSDDEDDGLRFVDEEVARDADATTTRAIPRLPLAWRRAKPRSSSSTSSSSSSSTSRVRTVLDAVRARTHSAASRLRTYSTHTTTSSNAFDDDGDFSSDDEGYNSRERTSSASTAASRPSATYEPRRPRMSSISMGVKLPNRITMNAMLRFRSSSSGTTTASEDDVIGGPEAAEPTTATMQDIKQKASVCATRAAGYLNAASAEAARRIKARAFRGARQHQDDPDEADHVHAASPHRAAAQDNHAAQQDTATA
ncbi:hypothetical protein ATCC90586_002762 [Pythium insidiosum]|nr:hypothetical protein ATCC90586_002762 [Pythium insidiosum]